MVRFGGVLVEGCITSDNLARECGEMDRAESTTIRSSAVGDGCEGAVDDDGERVAIGGRLIELELLLLECDDSPAPTGRG